MQNQEVVSVKTSESPAEVITSFRGLCQVCALGPTCTYVRHPEHAVLQCGEFEGYPPRPERIPKARVQEQRDLLNRTGIVGETITLKGLCVNCDARFTCTYPKPEGGVWRCEEYE